MTITADTFIEHLSAKRDCKRIVVHVCRNPGTGVWAMMKALTEYQLQQPGQVAALGVLAGRTWPQVYWDELQCETLPYLCARVPYHSATIAYLAFILESPVRRWYRTISGKMPRAEIILHFHSAWMTGGFFPLPANDRLGIVSTFHGIADDHRLQRIWWLRTAHRLLAQRLYRSNAILTAVSRQTTVSAERIFDIPDSAFHIIPNGLPNNASHQIKLESANSEFTIGHVGQMHEGKGWHLLLAAVDQLRQYGSSVKLLLAGAGQDSERVQAAAEERSDYVRFLGYVPNAAQIVMPRLDVLVLATWSEGMPMSIIEAFAAGVPVLATQVGGIPEMIEDGVNGLFIERNIDSIRQGLERLLYEPGLVERLREGARRTFLEKFNISAVAAAYDRVYDQALAVHHQKECAR